MQTATNPETGETVVLVNGGWQKSESTASNERGEKAYLLGGKWLTDTPAKPPINVAKEAAFGPIDTAAALASSAVAGPMAGLTGLIGAALPGDRGQGAKVVEATQDLLTYRPRTETGKAVTGAIAAPFEWLAGKADQAGEKVSDATGSPLAGTVVNTAIQSAPLLLGKGAKQVVDRIPAPVVREPPSMPGMGAAMTDIERLRWERAQQLPVPLPYTKGMRSRDFEQQRFERETAKAGDIGAPIRDRHAELNERILQNFDAFVDQTGAEAGGLRAAGQIVNDAIVGKSKMAKSHIDAAYTRARESGAMAAPVNVSPIMQYVESHRPEAINAPIIASLEAKLNTVSRKDPYGNTVATINDLEEVRKMVGSLSGKDATNAHFGREIKTLVDGLTENVGGADYKRARSLRLRYAKEFEDVGVIDKLMSTKPGTRDRAVAYEDVFQHSVLSGSLDDVRAVRKTLQTAGPEGAQAWKELQGQTVQHIKDVITTTTTDLRGNPVISAARLDRVIRELDKDGKLDFMFGKQSAQQMRDITSAAKDVLTFPPGSVNTSGTASVLMEALGNASLGRMPTAASQTIMAIKKMRASNAMKKRVADALRPPEN